MMEKHKLEPMDISENYVYLTLRLLMSYIYIYEAPSKARNANVMMRLTK